MLQGAHVKTGCNSADGKTSGYQYFIYFLVFSFSVRVVCEVAARERPWNRRQSAFVRVQLSFARTFRGEKKKIKPCTEYGRVKRAYQSHVTFEATGHCPRVGVSIKTNSSTVKSTCVRFVFRRASIHADRTSHQEKSRWIVQLHKVIELESAMEKNDGFSIFRQDEYSMEKNVVRRSW